jgi:hypothetical protein
MKAAVKVVGMVAGQRQHVVAQVSEGDPVLLLPEPDNPHDPYAIAVYTMPRTLLTAPVVSSLRDDVERTGMLDPADRQTIIDRQAGYLPADLAADLDLDPDGIVGFVSTVRYAPHEYLPTGEPADPQPAGFDVCAWLDRHHTPATDPDLDQHLEDAR